MGWKPGGRPLGGTLDYIRFAEVENREPSKGQALLKSASQQNMLTTRRHPYSSC